MVQPKGPRGRLQELEALRTAAFLAVVAQHVLGAYVRRAGTTAAEQAAIGLLFGLCKFAVPMFLFLSGAVLFLRYYGRLEYGKFLRRRLITILGPFLCWCVLYYLYGWWDLGVPPWGKREFLRLVLTCSVSYHTWYVGLIVQFYVFLPLIFALFRGLARLCRTRRGLVLTVLGFGAVWLALMQFAPVFQGIPVLGWLLYDQRAQNGIYYLGYFLLGGICGLYRDAFYGFVRRWLPGLAAATVLGYVWSEWVLFQNGFAGGQVNLNWMGSLNLHMTLFSMASILFLYGLTRKLPQGAGKGRWYCFVGRHSYSAYLAHAMVITTCSRLLLHWQGLPLPVFYGILMAAAVVVSVLVGWAFDGVWNGFWNRLPGRAKK